MAGDLKQQGLFELPRQSHAPTSAAAAAAASSRAKSQNLLVLGVLREAGADGLTDEEIYAKLSELLRAGGRPPIKESSARRARVMLMNDGFVARRTLADGTLDKRATTQGANAQVWILAELQEGERA